MKTVAIYCLTIAIIVFIAPLILLATVLIAAELWKSLVRTRVIISWPGTEMRLLQDSFTLNILFSDWRKFKLRLIGEGGEIKAAEETEKRICNEYREKNPTTTKNNSQIIEERRSEIKKELKKRGVKSWKIRAFS